MAKPRLGSTGGSGDEGVPAELGTQQGAQGSCRSGGWGVLSTPGTRRGDSRGTGGWELTGRAETPGEPGLPGGDGGRCLLNLAPTDEKKKKIFFAGSKFSRMQLALSTTPSLLLLRCLHPFSPGSLRWKPTLCVPRGPHLARNDPHAGQEQLRSS